MTYGLPYMGSKRKIADDIIRELPRGEVLVDLFAGGCAITHCALLSGKWKRVIANDVSDVVRLFGDAVAGKYRDESRWISREDFSRLKDSDPYVRYCWSFGNNGQDYIYGREIERFKKRAWQIMFANSPAARYDAFCGFAYEFAQIREGAPQTAEDIERLCADSKVELLPGDIRAYFLDALKKSGYTAEEVNGLIGTTNFSRHYIAASQWRLPTEDIYQKMQAVMPALTIPWTTLHDKLGGMGNLIELCRLQSIERLKRLQSLEHLQGCGNLTVSQKDYRDVEIPTGAVVYCDPPYKGTREYLTPFDHAAFYDWLRTRDYPVYVSEYSMPDDFVKIWGKMTLSILSASSNSAAAPEGLYLHERWLHTRKAAPKQLTLFNFQTQ